MFISTCFSPELSGLIRKTRLIRIKLGKHKNYLVVIAYCQSMLGGRRAAGSEQGLWNRCGALPGTGRSLWHRCGAPPGTGGESGSSGRSGGRATDDDDGGMRTV